MNRKLRSRKKHPFLIFFLLFAALLVLAYLIGFGLNHRNILMQETVDAEDTTTEDEADEEIDPEPVVGVISSINDYGFLVPSITGKDLISAGYKYGDLLDVTVGTTGSYKMPLTSEYFHAGLYGMSLIDLNQKQGELQIACLNVNLSEKLNAQVGDSVIISMSEPAVYRLDMAQMTVRERQSRADGMSVEDFANFREVDLSGMASGVLYRGSSPVDLEGNEWRCQTADSLLRSYHVASVVDLADTQEHLDALAALSDYDAPNFDALRASGNVFARELGVDYTSSSNQEKLREVFEYLIEADTPVYIHCRQGKDRTGFVCILIEALAGAPREEIIQDYMLSYVNDYGIPEGSAQYKTIQNKTIGRIFFQLESPEAFENVQSIDWDVLSDTDGDLQSATKAYLRDQLGMSEEQIEALQEKFSASTTR